MYLYKNYFSVSCIAGAELCLAGCDLAQCLALPAVFFVLCADSRVSCIAAWRSPLRPSVLHEQWSSIGAHLAEIFKLLFTI